VYKIPRFLLLWAIACWCVPAHGDLAPRVAIFAEKGFPQGTGRLPVAAQKLARTLRSLGFESQILNAEELADSTRLSPSLFPALVLPSGNAFPKNALPNLHAYHRAGGCLVLSGVPFSHPCELQEKKWKDLGHANFYEHRGEGMGTGGFHSSRTDEKSTIRIPVSPLQIPPQWFPPADGRTQWLDPKSLDPADDVVPIVDTVLPDQTARPAAALIRHRCQSFLGACDVWLGHCGNGNSEADAFRATQLLVRGVLWALREKEQIAQEKFDAGIARLNQEAPPAPLPAGLEWNESPMPWGPRFIPKSATPARQMRVVSLAKLSADERVAITCLQGLTCRTLPEIWLVRNAADRFWLEQHQQQGHIDSVHEVADWTRLVAEFRPIIRGVVVPDLALYRGDLIAANVAACEDLLVASPELAERLGLEVRIDLRGRFETYVEGLRWMWETYRDRFNRHVCDYMQPARLRAGNFAFAYQWRAPMVWICGDEDEAHPGADRFQEKRAVAEIFAQMHGNIPVFGFPAADPGIGIGEPPGVELASRYGKALVCTDHTVNAGVMSGFSVEALRTPEQPPAPPLQRDKVYVALVVSDGDNQNAWHQFFRSYFEHPSHGKFPLAFGIGPAIRELQPAVAQWYYDRATPTTEFIADVSGAAYMQPDHWGEAYREPDRLLSGFLDWTAKMLPPMGLRTLRTVHGEDKLLAQYAKALPFCHSIFADMGCYSGHKGIRNLTYALPDGMPVFRAATTWRNFGNGFLGEIREQVGSQRPAFVNGFVHCWTFRPGDIQKIVESADPDMVFVTPSQLAQLYREAQTQVARTSPK
jgi:hypothetical protein